MLLENLISVVRNSTPSEAGDEAYYLVIVSPLFSALQYQPAEDTHACSRGLDYFVARPV